MNLRWRFLLVTWMIGLFFAVATSFIYYQAHRNHYLTGIDARLATGAQMARHFVGADFHDRLIDARSLDPEAYRAIVAHHNAASIDAGFQYLWSNLFLPDGRIVFTTATSPGKVVEAGDHAGFFTAHSDPAAFDAVRAGEQPVFSTFHNEWGEGRMALLPYRDAQGRLYVFGASMDLEPIEQHLIKELGWALGLFALLFLLASLAAQWLSRSMVTPLRQLQRTAEAIARGDYTTPEAHGGGDEIETLSASVHQMRDTIRRTLQDLRDSETRFRTLIDTLPDLVWQKDPDGVYLACNRRFERFFGAAETDILGKRDDNFVDAEQARAFRAHDLMAIRNGKPSVNEEYVTFADDGHGEWLETTKIPMFDSEGRLLGVLGIGHDITQRKNNARLLEVQHGFAGALMLDPDLATLQQAILRATLSLPDVDAGGLYWREANGDYRLIVHEGLTPDFVAAVEHIAADSPRAGIIRAGRLRCDCQQWGTHCTDPDLLSLPNIQEEGIHALAILPIMVHGEALACLNIVAKQASAIAASSLATLETLARQFSRALERLRAEDVAKQLQRNFSDLFDALTDYLFIIDQQGRVVHYNRPVAETLGYNDSLLGQPVITLHPPAMQAQAGAILADIAAGLEDTCRLPLIRADGAQVMVETRVTRGDWNGQPVLIGIARDIGEQLRTLQALYEAREFLDTSQRIAHLGGWKVNPASNSLTWTDEIHHLLDVPFEHAPADLEEGIRYFIPEYQAVVTQKLHEAWANDTPFILECEAMSASGRRFWAELRCRGRVPVGEDTFLIGTFQDISARKHAEEMQRFGAFQAGVAEMSVSVLHNIGNAITSVVADTNAISRAIAELARVVILLERNHDDFKRRIGAHGLNPTQAQHLLAVQQQAAASIQRLLEKGLAMHGKRINVSVEHIADIVRLQQNAALPDTASQVFSLRQALDDALSMHADSLRKHGIEVGLRLDAALPPLRLSRNRLLQALLNVIKNAQEAIRARPTEPGYTGRIEISAEPLGTDRLRLTVRDNGVGIEPDQCARVFEFGFSTKGRGSGFGLHATALFVRELGGRIELHSEGPNQGATLVMELPCQIDETALANSVASPWPARAANRQPTTENHKEIP